MAGTAMTEACRLCLLLDSKLIPIDMQFENSMRNILGQNITYESGLPKYICNDCADFLKWFKEFKDRCLKAQTVLYHILKTAGQVTESQIRKLNRKRLKLDTKITPLQKGTEEPEPTGDIPSVDEPSESVVKEETLHSEVEVMEESESETEDKSYVFEGLEEESDVLLDATNPLEEETVRLTEETKGDLTLPPEHADLSEGFNIFQPPGAGYCLFEFSTTEEYSTHAMQHRTYNCRRCSFSATDVKAARDHRQQKHGDKIYSCCYCNYRTTESLSFEQHVRARHALQLVCAACGSCFDSRRGLNLHTGRLHKRTDTGTKRWDSMGAQKNCKKKTKKTNRIFKVLGKRKVEADVKLLCRKCDIQFSTTSAWRRHIDSGHVVNEYEQEVPRKKKKIIGNYSNETLKKAFDVVKNKEMGIRAASRVFKIPRTTLQDRIKDGHFSPLSKRGPPPIFSEEEEGVIVEFVKSEGSLNRQEVIEQATVLAKQVNREKFFKNGKPGMTWYTNFLRRHPELQQYLNKWR